MTSIKVVAELDGYDIASQLEPQQGLQLIKEIDLAYADGEFTESVILMLYNDLKREYDQDEWDRFLKELT